MPPETAGVRSILIFRLGALGDTLVAIPSFNAIRRHFPHAKITILGDAQSRANSVVASDLLLGSSLVDSFLLYPVSRSRIGRFFRPIRMLFLAWQLRRRRFDYLIYLAPSGRQPHQVSRDRRFFQLAGIRQQIGMDVPMGLPSKQSRPLPKLAPEMGQLLSRLNASGIPAPPATPDTVALPIHDADIKAVEDWLHNLPNDKGRPWVAVAPGSKMPAKRWPVDRYRDVVAKLIEQHDIWPVIFGGNEDRTVGDDLLRAWGRGYNAAGALSLRPSAAAIGRCKLYLGNDTGTMHLAAAASIPCVAIFSSRDFPGLWEPFGSQNTIFRTPIDCEGCMLQTCLERKMECISRITPHEVIDACASILHPAPSSRPPSQL